MEFSSCLYTTQGEYICERQHGQNGDIVEGFYNQVMSPAVIKNRLNACYPGSNNFQKDSPQCISQMHLIAYDTCKTRDPASKSFPHAKVCTIGKSPNPKIPSCSKYIANNAQAYINKFNNTYNLQATYSNFVNDSTKVAQEFSLNNCLPPSS